MHSTDMAPQEMVKCTCKSDPATTPTWPIQLRRKLGRFEVKVKKKRTFSSRGKSKVPPTGKKKEKKKKTTTTLKPADIKPLLIPFHKHC